MKGKNLIKMFEMLRFNNIDLIPTQAQDIQDLSQQFLDSYAYYQGALGLLAR